jgi:hypothetical protein
MAAWAFAQDLNDALPNPMPEMPVKFERMTAQFREAVNYFEAAERECLALGPSSTAADVSQVETDLHQAIQVIKVPASWPQHTVRMQRMEPGTAGALAARSARPFSLLLGLPATIHMRCAPKPEQGSATRRALPMRVNSTLLAGHRVSLEFSNVGFNSHPSPPPSMHAGTCNDHAPKSRLSCGRSRA